MLKGKGIVIYLKDNRKNWKSISICRIVSKFLLVNCFRKWTESIAKNLQIKGNIRNGLDFPKIRNGLEFPKIRNKLEFPKVRNKLEFPTIKNRLEFPKIRNRIEFPKKRKLDIVSQGQKLT